MAETLQFFVLPKFSSMGALADFLARLAWYLHPFQNRDFKIWCILSPAVNPQISFEDLAVHIPTHFDPKVRFCLQSLMSNNLELVSENAMKGTRIRINHVLLWNRSGFNAEKEQMVDYVIKVASAIDARQIPTHNLDVSNNPFERQHFIDIFGMLLGNYQSTKNRDRLEHLCTQFSVKDGEPPPLVIGKPPTSDQIQNLALQTNIFICSNTAIFLDDVVGGETPVVVTFMDATMAGCSQFAGKYRERLAAVLEQDTSWLVTWEIYEPFIAPVHSEASKQRAVFMPRETVPFPSRDVNIDLRSRFISTDVWNVVTSLALPLALTLSNTVYLYGLEGKTKEQQTWKPTVPGFSGDDTIYATHPFVGWNMSQEYENHELTLAALLAQAEAAGKSIVSLTQSYFESVQARYDSSFAL